MIAIGRHGTASAWRSTPHRADPKRALSALTGLARGHRSTILIEPKPAGATTEAHHHHGLAPAPFAIWPASTAGVRRRARRDGRDRGHRIPRGRRAARNRERRPV